jgi:hypothetical protein
MQTINVEGLPEPIVRSLEAVVETVRQQLREPEKPREHIQLLTKKGTVRGSLTREEIYEDAGGFPPP